MEENMYTSEKSLSLKEPSNMITIQLNRSGFFPEDTKETKNKNEVDIKCSRTSKFMLTSSLSLLGIFSLAVVILLIRGYTSHRESIGNSELNKSKISLNHFRNDQNKLRACKVSKKIEDCCYIFLKTNLDHQIEKCTVQKVLDLFLLYELEANKRIKRQNYKEFDYPKYNEKNRHVDKNFYTTAFYNDPYATQHYYQGNSYADYSNKFSDREKLFQTKYYVTSSHNQNDDYFKTQDNSNVKNKDSHWVSKAFYNSKQSTTKNRSSEKKDKLNADRIVKTTLRPLAKLSEACSHNECATNISSQSSNHKTDVNNISTKQSSKMGNDGQRISQGHDFDKQTIETQTPNFSKQVINPCFYPFQPPFFHPNRASTSLDANQMFTMMPTQSQPLYVINPPMYPYLPLQYQGYNYQNPQIINRVPIAVASNTGQYYMCNPVSVPLNNIANLPGVEVRKIPGPYNLQEIMQSMPKASTNNNTRAALNCPIGERGCSDGNKCIHIKQFCDNEIDCIDGSDEENCSCKNRIWEMRWCDGYFDCPNGEDEEGCFGCSEGEYSCDDWSRFRVGTCIPLSQRCDGIKQCEITGKDEEDCSILTDHLGHHSLYTVSNAVGFLHRNYKGQWYPTCLAADTFALDVCRTEAGPSGILPRTHLMESNDNFPGPFIQISPNGHIALENECLGSKATFVECPPIFCGLRLTINNSFRTTEVDTSAEELLNQLQRFNSNHRSGEIVGSSRVVGGKPSQPAAWPWVVSIYKNGFFHCGGVLINDLWIVTAAHCVDKFWFFYYEIQAGALRRFSYSPMEQSRWAVLAIPHEDYSKKTLKNDIALMKLSKPLRFNRYVRPICLPSESTAGEDFLHGPKPNTICVTVGWGATVEHGTDPDHLREVEIPILPHCKHIEDKQGDEICAGLLEGGRDACQGDSGGPLMCQNIRNRSQWYLAGIVSHGEGCARPNEPGVYTRVSKYVGWIGESINGKTMRRFPLRKCPGYICKATGRCLPKKRHCDKVIDCLFGDDELNCWKDNNGQSPLFRSHIVGSTQIQPQSIPNHVVNNKYNDVKENYNNIKIKKNNTTVSLKNKSKIKTFTCRKMLQIIPSDEKCNKVLDCEDGTDEVACLCVDYLKRFHQEAVCDGIIDCKDISDESNCTKCQPDQYLCKMDQKCIPSSKKCDGTVDCIQAEDEWDCVTLTDGENLTLDSDLRPLHSSKGIITINRSGVWRPLCNATSERASVAADICNLLGFEGYRMYHKFPVADKLLNAEKEGTTCEGLFVSCSETGGRDNVNAGAELYTSPWNALIYSDGEFRCTGTILDPDWIITTKACFVGTSLNSSYISVVLGKGKAHLDVEGPHEQAIPIIGTVSIEKSNVLILRTSKKIAFDRYVTPTRLSVSSAFGKEKCVAVGFEAEKSRFVFLHSLEKCSLSFRCFQPVSCNITTLPKKWTGIITCDSRNGWYPAATFEDVDGSCGFSDRKFESVDKIKVMEAMKRGVFEEIVSSECDGFRCILGQCIEDKKVCDGIPDCRSNEDEDLSLCLNFDRDCHLAGNCRNSSTCKWWEFKCRNGKCIPKSSFCDNVDDCGDLFDEPTTCSCKTYIERVYPEKICDGTVNCWDRSDENPKRCRCQFPTNITCGETKWCISREMICDSFIDCPNGEDESNCYSLLTNYSSINRGEVMKLTAGVWHSSCFREKITTLELEEICMKLGFSGGSAKQITTANDDNVTVPVRDRFDVVWIRRGEGNKFKLRLRTGNKPYVKFIKDTTCHKLDIECL